MRIKYFYPILLLMTVIANAANITSEPITFENSISHVLAADKDFAEYE